MDRTFVLEGLEFSSVDDAEIYVAELERQVNDTETP